MKKFKLAKKVSRNSWYNRRQSYTDCFIKDQNFQVIWQDMSWKLLVTNYELPLRSWKRESTSLNSNLRLQIHELRVEFYEFRVQIHMLSVQIHELRVQTHELPVKIHKLRFKSTSYEFKSTICEFKSTSSRIKENSGK